MELPGDINLTSRWIRWWRNAPERPVVRDENHEWLTGLEVDVRSSDAAARLKEAGLRSGDRLMVVARSSVPSVLVYVAALRLGLVIVPVNPDSAPDEVARVIEDSDPAAFVVDREAPESRRLDQAISAVSSGSTGSSRRNFPSRPSRGAVLDLVRELTSDVRFSAREGENPLDKASAHDPALLLYTSGTTGIRKGAVLTHGNLLSSARALEIAWRWAADDRLVLALPLFHLHGLGVGLFGSFCAGASVVLRRSFDPEDVLDTIDAEQASLFFAVPTMLLRLAGHPRVDELRFLRLCVSGSAPLAPEVHRTMLERAGLSVLERYGMTETVMNVSNPYDGERRPGTVGFPLPGVQVRLDRGSGEILVRGPNVFGGYLNEPRANAEAFEDGWFRTGDIGEFDDDGYLKIVGRCKELIISGGQNVYPKEVEDVLRHHPAVSDAAVVGLPDDEWGERVVAFVELESDAPTTEPRTTLSTEELMAFARSRLAPYKRPKEIHLLPSLPRNELGKVVRSLLTAATGG